METVGFVLPGRQNHLSDPFLSEILDGLATELAVHDWDLLLAAVPDEHDEIAVMDRLIRFRQGWRLRPDAYPPAGTRASIFCGAAGVPFAAYGRTENPDDYSWLDIDNEKAFVDAIAYLADMGHRDIGLLGGDLSLSHAFRRKQGFLAGLEAHGLSARADWIIDNVRDEMGARDAVEQLLAVDQRPTAIICNTDSVAIGAIHALQRAGLTVGRDMSVVGYDGACPWAPPSSPRFPR